MKKVKKAMTLIETILVVMILGILSTMLVRTYIQMSEISFRVEQEKNVTQEVLVFSQILQNLADRNAIDYARYEEKKMIRELKENNGIVDVLYLSGIDGQITIHSAGECIDPGITYKLKYDKDWEKEDTQCRVEITKNNKTFNITHAKKAYISKVLFKIIPYATRDMYLYDESLCDTNYLVCPHQPGFRAFAQAYSTNYGSKRTTNIKLPIQQFFSTQ